MNPRHSRLDRYNAPTAAPLLLFLLYLATVTSARAQTSSPAPINTNGKLHVRVLVNTLLPYSEAVWTAVTNNAANMPFLQGAERIPYSDSTELFDGVTDAIAELTNQDYLLIIGPAQ